MLQGKGRDNSGGRKGPVHNMPSVRLPVCVSGPLNGFNDFPRNFVVTRLADLRHSLLRGLKRSKGSQLSAGSLGCQPIENIPNVLISRSLDLRVVEGLSGARIALGQCAPGRDNQLDI